MADEELQFNGQTLGSYRVTDLKDILKQVGKAVGGTKAVLIKRLADHIRENGLPAGNQEPTAPAAATTAGNLPQISSKIFEPDLISTAHLINEGGTTMEMPTQLLLQQQLHDPSVLLQLQQAGLQQFQQHQLLQQQMYEQQQIAAMQSATLGSNNTNFLGQLSDFAESVLNVERQLGGMASNAVEEVITVNSFVTHANDTIQSSQPTIDANEAQNLPVAFDSNGSTHANRVSEDDKATNAEVVTDFPIQTIAAETDAVDSKPSATEQRGADDEVSFAIDQDDLRRYVEPAAAVSKSSSSSSSRHRHHRERDGGRLEQPEPSIVSTGATLDAVAPTNAADRVDSKRKAVEPSQVPTGESFNDSIKNNDAYSNGVEPLVGSSEQSAAAAGNDAEKSTLPTTQNAAPKPIKLRRTDRPKSPIVSSSSAASIPTTPIATTVEPPTNDASAVEKATPASATHSSVRSDEMVVDTSDSAVTAAGEASQTEILDAKLSSDDSAPTNKESVVDDEGATNVVLISNLMRPFNIPQLRQLIGKHGDIAEGENTMWLDRIKSQCVCRLTSVAHAVKVQRALNNIVWPDKSSKHLRVEYESDEMLRQLLERSKNGEADITPQQVRQEKTDLARSRQQKSSRQNSTRQLNGNSGAVTTGNEASEHEKRTTDLPDADSDVVMSNAEKPVDPSLLVTVSLRDRRAPSPKARNRDEIGGQQRKIADTRADNAEVRTGRDAREQDSANQGRNNARAAARETTSDKISTSRPDTSAGRNTEKRHREADGEFDRGEENRSKAWRGEKPSPPTTVKNEQPKTLDELFKKTVAKPPIYYMTVDADVAGTRREHRLGKLNPLAAKASAAGSVGESRGLVSSDNGKARPQYEQQHSTASSKGIASGRMNRRDSGEDDDRRSSKKINSTEERTRANRVEEGDESPAPPRPTRDIHSTRIRVRNSVSSERMSEANHDADDGVAAINEDDAEMEDAEDGDEQHTSPVVKMLRPSTDAAKDASGENEHLSAMEEGDDDDVVDDDVAVQRTFTTSGRSPSGSYHSGDEEKQEEDGDEHSANNSERKSSRASDGGGSDPQRSPTPQSPGGDGDDDVASEAKESEGE